MEPAAQPSEIRRHLAELMPAEAGVVTATLAGMVIAGPPGALVAGTAAAAVQHITKEAMARRFQRATEAVEVAAAEAGLTAEELLDRIRSDGHLLELAASVIAAAAETTLQAKIQTLGKALARGTLATDDAEIDQERYMVGTFAVLEAPHVRVLHQANQRYESYRTERTSDGRHQAYGWTLEALRKHLPGMVPVLGPVLATLSSHDLIVNTATGTLGHVLGENDWWALSDYGRQILDLLEARGSSEPDPSAQEPSEG